MRKQMIAAFLTGAIALTCTGCGGGTPSGQPAPVSPAPAAAGNTVLNDDAEKYPDAKVIKLANTTSTAAFNDQSNGVAVVDKYFIEQVPIRTEGRYRIEYFPDGQLAKSTEEIIGGVQSGAFDLTTLAIGQWGEYTNAFAEINVPFLFKSFDQVHYVLDNGLAERMLAQVEQDVGVKPLLFNTIGFRQITNSRGVIKSPDDLKGLKLRVMNDPIQIASFEALGVSVTNVAYAELFTALQQKLCDGEENPPSNVYNDKFYEVQKYLSKTNHSYTVSCFFMNKNTFNSMSPEDQQIIMEISKEAQQLGRQKVVDLDDWYYEQLASNGMDIYEPTPEELQVFSDKMVSGVWPTCQEIMGDERWNYLQDAVKKADEALGI